MDLHDRLRRLGDDFEQTSSRSMPSADLIKRISAGRMKHQAVLPKVLALTAVIAVGLIVARITLTRGDPSRVATAPAGGPHAGTNADSTQSATSAAAGTISSMATSSEAQLPRLGPGWLPDGAIEDPPSWFDERTGDDDGWAQLYVDASAGGKLVVTTGGGFGNVTPVPSAGALVGGTGEAARRIEDVVSSLSLDSSGYGWTIALPSSLAPFAQGPVKPFGLQRSWTLPDSGTIYVSVYRGLGSLADTIQDEEDSVVEIGSNQVLRTQRPGGRVSLTLPVDGSSSLVSATSDELHEFELGQVLASVHQLDDDEWNVIVGRARTTPGQQASRNPIANGDPMSQPLAGLPRFLPTVLPVDMDIHSPTYGRADHDSTDLEARPGDAVALGWTKGARSVEISTFAGVITTEADSENVDTPIGTMQLVDGVKAVQDLGNGIILMVATTGLSRAEILATVTSLQRTDLNAWADLWYSLPNQ